MEEVEGALKALEGQQHKLGTVVAGHHDGHRLRVQQRLHRPCATHVAPDTHARQPVGGTAGGAAPRAPHRPGSARARTASIFWTAIGREQGPCSSRAVQERGGANMQLRRPRTHTPQSTCVAAWRRPRGIAIARHRGARA